MPLPAKNVYRLYQIGRGTEDYFIFSNENFDVVNNVSFKNDYITSNNQDGSQNNRGGSRPYKEDYKFQTTFTIDTQKISENYIHKIFQSGRKIAFFYQITDELDGNKKPKLRWFYNYVHIETPPNQRYSQTEDSDPNLRKSFTVTLRSDKLPYYFECTKDIRYFDESAFGNNKFYWSSTSLAPIDNVWGTTTAYWGQTYLSAFPTVSSVSTTDFSLENELFVTKQNIPVELLDRFLYPTNQGIGSDDVLSQTLANNDKYIVTTEDLNYKNTTSENRIFLLEFEPLSQGEYIEMYNPTNNTGVRIIWESATVNSNNVLFNSATGRFYDVVTHKILPLNYARDEAVGGGFLSFSALLNINPYLGEIDREKIYIQKNSSSSNDIKLRLLQTYA